MLEDIIAAFEPDVPVDEDYCKVVAKIESGDNPLARAVTSSATGLYQFIDSTWIDMFNRHCNWIYGWVSSEEVLELRLNAEISKAVFKCFTDENREILMKVGVVPTYGDLYLAHFLGAGTARRILTSPSVHDILDTVLDTRVVQANLFLKGKTVQWLIDWADRKTKVV